MDAETHPGLFQVGRKAGKMIEKSVIDAFEKRLGKDKVFTQPEYRLAYSYDATGLEFVPDMVVFPENEADVSNLLALAFQHRIPVTPRGAGVGYSGGSLPVEQGIVLVFTRMNRILHIDTENFMAEVEPGVVTYDLQQAVEKKGLFYPPDPASHKTSTIGGNVAENAGGLRCFKYGVTGDYVLELEAFLITGEKIKSGSHTIKNVAGYDLKSLLVGSEGTLAVISKVVLKLLPLPEMRLTFRVNFQSLKKGAEFINQVISGRVYPSVLEFMDRTSLEAVHRYLELPLADQVQASVLVEIDGNRLELEERKNKLSAVVKGAEATEFLEAQSEEEQDRLWLLRRSISPAIGRIKPKKINEDIVVPPSKIPEAVSFINDEAGKAGITVILFGHFGDGNIHTNLMVDPADPGEMQRADQLLDKILRYVISVKGSITGEHGVGLTKKPFMAYQFSPLEIDLFRKIKTVFDPLNLLNPGKIF